MVREKASKADRTFFFLPRQDQRVITNKAAE